MRNRLTIALFVAVATAAAVIAQTSQSRQSSTDQPKPTFHTEANYVRVDMYAMADGTLVDDLKAEEVELLEDGVVQKIESFEHVKVRPAGPQESRIEPNTVRDSRSMAADPHARLFVIFLDTNHVQIEGSHNMRLPLVRFLDRVIGQEDLVGVMTPEMSAANLTFGRKTDVISGFMQEDWAWGRRDRVTGKDDKEERYETCYPPNDRATEGIADEMTDRRREQLSLDALDDLVRDLRGLREERTAVLTVSEGWMLYRPNRDLARLIKGQGAQGRPEVFVGDGKVAKTDPRSTATGATMYECDSDRTRLALLDDSRRVIDLVDEANRANVSFYSIYPRGLVAFDSPIGPRQPPSPARDIRNLESRHDSLRTLATNTDGLAIVNGSEIDSAMRRIVDDLTSYYLLGYYSNNTKLDGKFRSISVRVKRPGVNVRARRGYRGRTAEDLTEAARIADREKAANAVSGAINTVSAMSSRTPFRIRTATWPTAAAAGDKTAGPIWIVGELDYKTRKELTWSAGGSAELVVVAASGQEVMNTTVDLEAGQGTFAMRVPESGGVPAGEYAVRVRVRPKQDDGLPVTDVARVTMAEQPSRLGEAVMWRRGPSTGPRFAMTADPRFQRQERVRLELATTGSGTISSRLLDRAGNPLQVPVAVGDRQDESGEFRWVTAEVSLAPLAAGDYAIEVVLDQAKVVTAFKVTP
jgi:VWFA-related protein